MQRREYTRTRTSYLERSEQIYSYRKDHPALLPISYIRIVFLLKTLVQPLSLPLVLLSGVCKFHMLIIVKSTLSTLASPLFTLLERKIHVPLTTIKWSVLQCLVSPSQSHHHNLKKSCRCRNSVSKNPSSVKDNLNGNQRPYTTFSHPSCRQI